MQNLFLEINSQLLITKLFIHLIIFDFGSLWRLWKLMLYVHKSIFTPSTHIVSWSCHASYELSKYYFSNNGRQNILQLLDS